MVNFSVYQQYTYKMTKNFIIKKLFASDKRKKSVCSGNEEELQGPAEFETAVSALGLGKFNFMLFLILVPTQWAMVFDTTLMAYISPIAQCDLNLTLDNKGIINAIPPLGGIVGAVFWGVIIDTIGRRNLITCGFLLAGIVTIITSFSQSYMFLLCLKFISGATLGGVYIAQCAYYAEFHSTEYRGKMQLAMGFISCLGQVVMPLLAAFFLPLDLTFSLFNGNFVMHSWNVLILVSSVLSFTASVAFMFLPESPKYLMTKGNEQEALSIFRKVYKINSGQSEALYPIKKLIHEQVETKYNGQGTKQILLSYARNGWHQVAPLFQKTFFPKLLLVTAIVFLILTNMNTMRLWLPQIFQSIHEYQSSHNGSTTQLCMMLETMHTIANSSNSTSECSVNTENNLSVYFNSMINSAVCMIGYAMAGTLINWFGKKKLLCGLGLISATTILTTYLSQNRAMTLISTSLILAATGISFDVIMTMIVVIFPTNLRATAISVVLVFGRCGIIGGNILFPILLQIGCAPPFLSLGVVATVATLLCLFIPATDNESLK